MALFHRSIFPPDSSYRSSSTTPAIWSSTCKSQQQKGSISRESVLLGKKEFKPEYIKWCCYWCMVHRGPGWRRVTRLRKRSWINEWTDAKWAEAKDPGNQRLGDRLSDRTLWGSPQSSQVVGDGGAANLFLQLCVASSLSLSLHPALSSLFLVMLTDGACWLSQQCCYLRLVHQQGAPVCARVTISSVTVAAALTSPWLVMEWGSVQMGLTRTSVKTVSRLHSPVRQGSGIKWEPCVLPLLASGITFCKKLCLRTPWGWSLRCRWQIFGIAYDFFSTFQRFFLIFKILHNIHFFKIWSRSGKMTQKRRCLLKPHNLNLIPRTHVVGREAWLLQIVLWPPPCSIIPFSLFICFCFCDTDLPCSPGWPYIHNPLTLTFLASSGIIDLCLYHAWFLFIYLDRVPL